MKLSEKKKKNAQAATEPEPTEPERPKSPATEEDRQIAEEINEAKAPFQLIPPFKIGGKAKGMAKAAGVDLSGVEAMAPRINEWASSVEERLNIVIAAIPNLPMETVKVLRAEAEKQRAEIARTQTPDAPASQGGGMLGALAQFLPMLAGGGGSGGVSDEITKQVVDAGIKQMFAGTRLLEAIQTKIMTEMGVKAVTEAVGK